MKLKTQYQKKIESSNPQRRAPSKDERIDQLQLGLKKCVDSASAATINTIPVLLFLAKALSQDEPVTLVMRRRGQEIEYGHAGNAVGPILDWLATTLYEGWDEIDVASLGLLVDMENGRLCGRNVIKSR